MLVALLSRSTPWKPATPAMRAVMHDRGLDAVLVGELAARDADERERRGQRVLPRTHGIHPRGGRGWRARRGELVGVGLLEQAQVGRGSRSQRSTGPSCGADGRPRALSRRPAACAPPSWPPARPAEVAESCSSIRSRATAMQRLAQALRPARRETAGRTMALCPASIARGAAASVSHDRLALLRAAERRGRRRGREAAGRVAADPQRRASARAAGPCVRSTRRLTCGPTRRGQRRQLGRRRGGERRRARAHGAAGGAASANCCTRPLSGVGHGQRRRGSRRRRPVGWMNWPGPVPRVAERQQPLAVGAELLDAVVAAVGDPEVPAAVEGDLRRAR